MLEEHENSQNQEWTSTFQIRAVVGFVRNNMRKSRLLSCLPCCQWKGFYMKYTRQKCVFPKREWACLIHGFQGWWCNNVIHMKCQTCKGSVSTLLDNCKLIAIGEGLTVVTKISIHPSVCPSIRLSICLCLPALSHKPLSTYVTRGVDWHVVTLQWFHTENWPVIGKEVFNHYVLNLSSYYFRTGTII